MTRLTLWPQILVLLFAAAGAVEGQDVLTPQDLINAQIEEFRGSTEPGKPIIDFSFSDLNGTFHTPVAYRGNVLLLWMIGYNNDTSIALAAEMEALRERHRDRSVILLALDLWNGTHAQLSNFKQVTQVSMPLLQNALSRTFPFAVDSSSMIVVDTEGIVQGIFGEEDIAGIERMIDLVLSPAPVLDWGPQSLFFGSSTETGSQTSIRITIRNNGTQDLLVTDIQSDIPELSFTRTELTLPPRAEEKIDAVLFPTTPGTVSGTVTITSNDPVQRTVTLAVDPTTVETGAPPVITAVQSTVNLGDVEVGQAGTSTFIIRNDGPGPLLVTDLQSDVAGVTFAQTSFVIQPGDSAAVSIVLVPSAQGTLAGSIRIFSNDPVTQSLDLALQANAVITPADPRTDFDGTGVVDFSDFLEFAQAFGSSDAKYDLDGDGTVGFADFLTFAESFGKPVNA